MFKLVQKSPTPKCGDRDGCMGRTWKSACFIFNFDLAGYARKVISTSGLEPALKRLSCGTHFGLRHCVSSLTHPSLHRSLATSPELEVLGVASDRDARDSSQRTDSELQTCGERLLCALRRNGSHTQCLRRHLGCEVCSWNFLLLSGFCVKFVALVVVCAVSFGVWYCPTPVRWTLPP